MTMADSLASEMRVSVVQALSRLDAVISSLRDDLEAVFHLQTVDRQAISGRLRQALDEHEAAIKGLRTLAEALEFPTPPWKDRIGFEKHLTSIDGQLKERALDRQRRQHLIDLSQTLYEGELSSYLPATRALPEQFRSEAIAELTLASAAPQPPDLPFPESETSAEPGRLWLSWIWNLPERERSRLLDDLFVHLPKLVSFVEHVKQEKFKFPSRMPSLPSDNLTVVSEPIPSLSAQSHIEAVAPIAPEQSVSSSVSVPNEATSELIQINALGGSISSESPVIPESLEPPLNCSQPSLVPSLAEAEMHPSFPRPAPSGALDIAQELPHVLTPPSFPIDSARMDSYLLVLPEQLRSLEQFITEYVVDSSGLVVRAPWRDNVPLFTNRLRVAMEDALCSNNFSAALIYSQALEQVATGVVLLPQDVQAMCVLTERPSSPSAGLDASRSERLQAASTEPPVSIEEELAVQFCLKTWLCLEAVRPTRSGAMMNSLDVPIFLNRAQFQNQDLATVIEFLLCSYSEGCDPTQSFTAAFQSEPSLTHTAGDDGSAAVERLRQEIRSVFRRTYSAAGGVLKTKHAIIVWDDWAKRAKPVLSRLFPIEHGGVHSVPVMATYQEISDLLVFLSQLLQQRQVLYSDGKRFERTARDVLDLAMRLLERMNVQPSQSLSKSQPLYRTPPIEALRALSAAAPFDSRHENALRHLILRVFDPSIKGLDVSLELTKTQREQYPQLAELEGQPITPDAALRIAHVLMRDVNSRSQDGRMKPADLPAQIATKLVPRLHQLATSLDQAAAMQLRQQVLDALREAEQLVQPPDDKQPSTERLRLATCWLEQIVERVDQTCRQLPRVDFNASPRHGRSRELTWRSAAEHELAETAHWFSRLKEEADAITKELLKEWEERRNETQTKRDQPLKTTFCKWVFDTSRQNEALYPIGENQGAFFRLPTEALLTWLQWHNPSFVPQLRQYNAVVVLTPTARSGSSSLLQTLWTQAAAHRNCLVVALVPGLSATRRSEIIASKSRADYLLAVLDDLDLLRLLNPQGGQPNKVIGLLEIIFEQQHVNRVVPFAVPDGQSAAPEMFVGRQEEAKDLAFTSNYSRVFSGRKLGKTALLRQVVHIYDGKSLPSELTLRVVYVSAVGVRHEHDLVDKLRIALQNQRGFRSEVPTEAMPPAAMLVQMLSRYLKEHPTDSLLFLLDESDVFMEEQLIAYSEPMIRESCLSFRMRSELTTQTDSKGLSRVRFVFVGYRVTDRSQGAWANWGHVLRLRSLRSDEAVQLLLGPLARIGINVEQQVDEMAFRCGYQPSLLLSFGRHLCHRLEHRQSPTADVIGQLCDQPELQEEIRTVVRLNFEGNPIAGLVFAVLCRVLEGVPSSLGVSSQSVLERIMTYSPKALWLGENRDAQREAIEHWMSEFAARDLVQLRSDHEARLYHLRFPHHLEAILGQRSQLDTYIRELIAVAERQGTDNRELMLGLLQPKQVADVLACLGRSATDQDVSAILVGWHWPEALGDSSGGVVSQVGLFGADVFDLQSEDLLNVDRALLRRCLAITTATVQVIKGLAPRRSFDLPPILYTGGADILRWGLHHERRDESLFEFCALGRLTFKQIEWWFRRRRGLEFSSPFALTELCELTSGIPLLVRRMDFILCSQKHGHPTTVSEQRWQQVKPHFHSWIAKDAALLRNGPRAFQLSPRERDVLVMLVCMSKLFDQSFTWTELGELYDNLNDIKSTIAPPEPEDIVSLQVLQMLGLVPARADVSPFDPTGRLLPIPKDDALLRLVEAMPEDV